MKYLSRFVVVFSLLLSIGLTAQEEPDPPDSTAAGAVWFRPYTQDCYKNDTVSTEVRVNSGEQLVGCYGIEIAYDTNVIEYVSCEAGADGFVSALNPELGNLIISGFDAMGKGPGDDLHLLTIKWIAADEGASLLDMTVNDLQDNMLVDVGEPTANDGIINVEDTTSSDSTIGYVWFEPDIQECYKNDIVSTKVRVNSGTDTLAAYGININYNSNVINYDTTTAGADGFISAINSEPGNLIIGGFDAAGTGPGDDLHVLTIKWIAVKKGSSPLELTIDSLKNKMGLPIGTPTANDGIINVAYIDSTIGSVWFEPDTQECYKNDTVSTEVRVNSGTQLVGSYNIGIVYDTNVINYDTTTAGADGFISAINSEPGNLIIDGYDAEGTGPGDNLHLLTINWISVAGGESQLDMTVNLLVDEIVSDIGIPNAHDGIINVEDTSSPDSTIGYVWFEPDSQGCTVEDTVSTEVRVNSGTDTLAAYGITINYDSSIIKYDTTIVGADGFVSVIDTTPESLIIAGFDAAGKGPGDSLHVLTIKWIAVKKGTSPLELTIDSLKNEMGLTVGTPSANDGIINVSAGGIEENGVSVKGISVLDFHSCINIQYNIEEKERVKVEIHNILGQRLAKLKDGTSPSGKYNLTWNGQPGIYFVRVEIGDKVYRKKALIIR